MKHEDNRNQEGERPEQWEQRSTIAWLRSAAGQQALLRETTVDGLTAKQIQRFRADFGAARGQAFATMLALRKGAETKLGLPPCSDCTWLTNSKGIQQSTDALIAAYKASRFPMDVPVVDVCCGVGGDAIALARRGPVLALDANPLVCQFAAHNLWVANVRSALVACLRAEQFQVPSGGRAWLHVDPDRRPANVRVSNADFYSPSSEVVARLLDEFEGGAIKLAPAATLPVRWNRIIEREWLSRNGQCRQQVAWMRHEDRPTLLRRATVLADHGGCSSISASEEDVSTAISPGADFPLRWLFDFDPAVRASGMTDWFAQHLGLMTLGGPAGFLTAEDDPASLRKPEFKSRLVACFENLWTGPLDLDRIRAELASRNCGTLEIKIRGVHGKDAPLSPETLRSKLLAKRRSKSGRSGRGDTKPVNGLTLLVGLPRSGRPFSVIARRID